MFESYTLQELSTKHKVQTSCFPMNSKSLTCHPGSCRDHYQAISSHHRRLRPHRQEASPLICWCSFLLMMDTSSKIKMALNDVIFSIFNGLVGEYLSDNHRIHSSNPGFASLQRLKCYFSAT